jgi:hypothetical protein
MSPIATGEQVQIQRCVISIGCSLVPSGVPLARNGNVLSASFWGLDK